jgi:phosphatidylserine decarboxylase
MDSLIFQEAPVLFISAVAVALVTSVLTWNRYVAATIPLVILALYFLYRAPEREPSGEKDAIVAPVDGRVLQIKEEESFIELVFFVHELDPQIQWMPYNGTVKSIKEEGSRTNANWIKYDMHNVADNKRVATTIGTPKGDIVVEQIRSIGTFQTDVFPDVEEKVEQSGHLGYMMFPARIDLTIPKACKVVVHQGQEVSGGRTVVAEFPGTNE